MEFPEQVEVTVNYKDYQNSSKNYGDVRNCPLAVAARRVLEGNLEVWVRTIWPERQPFRYFCETGFTQDDFKALRRKKKTKKLLFIRKEFGQ